MIFRSSPMTVHASESGHWYDRDGKPVYTVKAKDGSDRPTNLRDARNKGYAPGVSSIIQCCHKAGLQIWMIDQNVLSALTLPRYAMESDDAFMVRVKVDAKEQARKASEKGTHIHSCIQAHYEGVPPSEEDWPYVNGAVKAITEHFGDREWIAEHSFYCPLGFGGKVDLHNDDAVVDFKSKPFGPDDKLSTWDEHAMQIAAYQEGLGMLGKRGAICYVSTTHPGLARVLEIPTVELLRGWDMFKGLLAYWQAKNKYWPNKVT